MKLSDFGLCKPLDCSHLKPMKANGVMDEAKMRESLASSACLPDKRDGGFWNSSLEQLHHWQKNRRKLVNQNPLLSHNIAYNTKSIWAQNFLYFGKYLPFSVVALANLQWLLMQLLIKMMKIYIYRVKEQYKDMKLLRIFKILKASDDLDITNVCSGQSQKPLSNSWMNFLMYLHTNVQLVLIICVIS